MIEKSGVMASAKREPIYYITGICEGRSPQRGQGQSLWLGDQWASPQKLKSGKFALFYYFLSICKVQTQ